MTCRTAFVAVLTLVLPLAAAERTQAGENSLTPEELSHGWILLFDGETDYGWKATSNADWKIAGGELSVAGGDKGLLCTTSEFADYVFKVDFLATKETNSGIFLRTPQAPTDPKSDCYELNIADIAKSPFPTGSIVGRQATEGNLGGEGWQTFEATCEGGRFTVKLDGAVVLDYTDPSPLGRGRIGLQFNEGPVRFRNVKLKPLGLQPLFNGRDLTGWKVYPDKTSVFGVTPEGSIQVTNGNGQLESEAQFGDFTLQLEIFSNGEGLNSGIFFRSIPGEFWQGYESQINNAFVDGDRTKPKDCGTGGFYRRQNARRVVANDFEWFHKTLVVSGDHMATWVNGYQVSDWTDPREPNDNPREGKRLAPGTLAIQGHDPTTDLSFKNIRAAEMSPRMP